MAISKLKVVFALQCGICICAPDSIAESVSMAPPKYYLYQNVPHNSAGGCALVNAKWWEDESGSKGVDGATPDPNGDYYTKNFWLDTRNESSGKSVPFACNSLHIGEVGGSWARLNIYTVYSSVFKVLGKGLFLHNGFSQLNWKPVTIDGSITVDSPSSSAFYIYDRYCDTVLNIPATMHSKKGACLRFFANSESGSSGSRTFVVKITGDCSDYNGNFRIGKDSNDLGRNTRFYPPEGGIAGSLTVKATGCVALGSKDVTVGEISFEDGSTFITGKGCLNVTNAFAASGTVNISFEGLTVPNIETPGFAILSVPAGSMLLPEKFRVVGVEAINCKSAALSVVENENGGKTLYATFVRNSVYVSPNGDDGNTGADESNPFKTLSHAVSVMSDGIIYAMPGTYEDGLCDVGDSQTQSRVHVSGRVMLLSTAGTQQTIIKGQAPTDGGEHGSGAARCVTLDDGAVIQGFTLTGGYTYSDDDDAALYPQTLGGGVYAKSGSAILDCNIYGNYARRGGGGYGGNYVRCTFGTNTISKGNWSGPDIFGQRNPSRCFDCIFRSQIHGYVHVYQNCDLYNCTFTTEEYGGVQYNCNVYNCLIRSKSNVTCANYTQYHNCVLAMQPNEKEGEVPVVVDCVITNLSDAIDADGRLLKGSPAIDKGNRDHYLDGWVAAGLDDSFLNGDFYGGQRIYNAKIDAGAVEYDWRGDYTDVVAKRRLEVVQASEDVESQEGESLKLADGAKFVMEWDSENGGVGLRMECVASVVGAGALSVSMDGETIATVTEGVSSVTWKSTKDSHVLEFSYSGAGEALIGSFENRNGLRIRLR